MLYPEYSIFRGENTMVCKKCGVELPLGAVFCFSCGMRQEAIRQRRRRGNGEGSVYKRGATWCCERTFDYEPEGRIFARKTGFKTKKEALEHLPKLQDPRVNKPTRKKSTQISLKELYDLWFPTHRASPKTMEGYRVAFPVFKPVWYNSMESMDIDDLQECLDDFVPKKGTSGKRTRQVAKTCLGLVYKYGIPRGYVPANLAGEANLAKFIKVKTGETSAKIGFSEEELEQIKDSIDVVPYADYIYCACYLGFRPSAFLGLDISNYSRKEKAITGGIKTEAGINRIVTISPKIQPIIDRLTYDKIAGPLFCGPDGAQMALKEYRGYFYEALEQIGISNPTDEYGRHRITPHSCRHTFATLLKSVSAPDRDKLELIGHTSEEMLRYYQDVSLSDLRRITDEI